MYGQLLVQSIFCVYIHTYILTYIPLADFTPNLLEKEQDWAISAIHIDVSAVDIYVGACKEMFSVSLWPDVYVYCVYQYVHIYQEYMLNLASGGTWGNRV